MNRYEFYHTTAADPYTYAREWKKRTGKKVIGHFCTYTPEEFVVAAGALPFRLFGSTENISRADAHLQAYACSLVRGGLEEALAGKLDFLDGTVFPHTCDSIQRLSDIWRLNTGIKNHFDVILPVQLHTESARDYMFDVLRKFRTDLEKGLGVSITDGDLRESITIFNEVRKKLRELYLIRSSHPGIISGSDINAIVKTSMIMDRKELLVKLTETVELLNGIKKDTPAETKKRLVLTGGICNNPDIHGILDSLGAAVVWDDLCTGTRYFEGEIFLTGDPVTDIGRRYLERDVCPAKYRSSTSRGDNLVDIVKKHDARGVIFMFLKFCDPQGFDYPYMKQFLDREKIPSMLLEIEDRLPSEGQLKTRFETFLDML
ncbi:MAG: 2-hydroxyacyl-CoA dehydratase [Spirochaetae bacterium HGW-Spirochaetae-1]|jgi:bzd-type benzoyl-CoA reductase N subunit|nr:MAG: 2-hydroxyacyl-CoA dehydratase [Spirochaetae bacterium HGW-Spirochaetae-1]